ncbi:MAG TPA: tripartite tricarboxylate transporter substrate binding protein [Burkholderiales bacterium]|nr:tripartite tricarboxylate transporter substrate binding protein [Burkholderiales bacterium]
MDARVGRLVVLLCSLCCGLTVAALVRSAEPAQYPTRAVRFIVPLSPGGTVDTLARAISARLTERWAQPVVVDNRPGANGSIGMVVGKNASPDGYTIIFSQNGILGIAPNIGPVPFDPVADYAPVSLIATGPIVLVVHPSLPAKTLREFIALAKSKPGQLTYASSSVGGVAHLSMELLSGHAGMQLIHVPYKGGGQAVIDAISGQVHAMMSGAGAVIPHAKAGRLRVIAVSSSKRTAVVPEVPTIAEQGFPGFEAVAWYAVLAPAGTSAAIVTKLNADLAWALGQTDVKKHLTDVGFDVAPSSPSELGQRIRNELKQWAPVVKRAKL